METVPTAKTTRMRSGHGRFRSSRSVRFLIALVLLMGHPAVAVDVKEEEVEGKQISDNTPFPTVTPMPSISPAPSDFPSLAPTGGTAGTAAPVTATEAPVAATEAPVATTPTTPAPVPTTTTPAPVAMTPAPVVAGTPAPVVAGTPAPVAGTPAPVVAGTPAPVVAGTPAPVVAGTPAPVAGTPAPVAGTPAPVAGTPAPVVTTEAPVAGDPAPTNMPAETPILSDFPSLVPSGAPQLVATDAPVAATPSPTEFQVQPPCMICPNGTDMTLPDATFEDFFTNETGMEITCEKAQEMGDSGTYTPEQCTVLQESLETICGCESNMTTGAPTASPVAEVTPLPTAAPVTPAPTLAPTTEMKQVKGEIYITLKVVADTMPEDVQAAYEMACTDFFGESLGQLDPPVRQVKARLLQQNKLAPQAAGGGDARALRRELQPIDGIALPPLLTLLRVEGMIDKDSDVNDLNILLLFAITGGTDKFISDLKALPNGLGIFFRSVEDVEAFDPDNFTPYPTPAPMPDDDDDDDDDLAAVGIVFAVIGGIVIVGAIGGAGWFLTKGRGEAASNENVPGESEAETPSEVRASAATAVAGTAASRTPAGPAIKASDNADDSPESDILPSGLIPPQQEDASDSVMPSEAMGASIVDSSEAGDNMSYTYSLEAGNMDQQTYATGVSGAGAISTLGGDQSTEYSGRPNMVSREVVAPPGKLGIVIDTTLEGPVVHKVNPGSPLDGVVAPGDIIVAIDDVDTRAMSASAITALMVKTASQERRMTVLSEDEAEST